MIDVSHRHDAMPGLAFNSVQRICRLFIACAALLAVSTYSSLTLAGISASLDKNTIAVGDSVRLSIRTDQELAADQIDTSSLQQDFRVLARSSSKQISMSNGQVSTETRFLIELQAINEGTYIIPALQVGKQKTKPLTISVSAQISNPQLADNSAGGTVNQPAAVLIEAEWESQAKVYVQQQINLKVRIYYLDALRDASLDEPRPKDALVMRLENNDRQGERVYKGQKYRFIERRYALFPQKSGKLVVPPIPMQMRVKSNKRTNSATFPFDIFDRGRVVTVRTKPLNLEVLPPASSFSGSLWLPAEAVQLNRSGLPTKAINVGDAINMQIDLVALGLTAEQLPEVQIAGLPAGLKLYPDEASLENTTDGRINRGRRQQTFVMIASEDGPLEIPEINVQWWDTKAGQQRSATLPAVTIQATAVAAVDDGLQTGGLQTGDVSLDKANKNAELASNAELNTGSLGPLTNSVKGAAPFWKWLAIFALFGWMLTLGAIFWQWFSKRSKHQLVTNERSNLLSLIKSLKQAAKANDAKQTRQLLQVFGQQAWPHAPPRTPQDWLSLISEPAVETALIELDAHLYQHASDSVSAWNGQMIQTQLLPTLQAVAKQKDRQQRGKKGKQGDHLSRAEAASIPELYPVS